MVQRIFFRMSKCQLDRPSERELKESLVCRVANRCSGHWSQDMRRLNVLPPNRIPAPPYSTPSVWSSGRTHLKTGGPCLSAASWTALLRFASVPSNMAERGVIGFGSFSQKKRTSSAGAKPGITKNLVDAIVG